jgi:hypothetical protein
MNRSEQRFAFATWSQGKILFACPFLTGNTSSQVSGGCQ